ncbi:MAG: hypothetical protein K0S85_1211 [Pseudomonas orientalis]|nr:hypothetical protein [Pseudomonas orientalis]
MPVCRSELAREKLIGTAFMQKARVIVDVFREQARSYKLALGLAPSHIGFCAGIKD